MTLAATLEAILFVSAKPWSVKRLAELTSASAEDVQAGITELVARLDASASGVMVQRHGHDVELVTRPEHADIVKQIVRSDAQGELTRASLETLTILAYRGPLTRPELEQIRGVHCSLILRNLMMRGLVEEKEDGRLGQPTYAVTFDFMNHLGIPSVEALPDYESLRGHAAIADVLSSL